MNRTKIEWVSGQAGVPGYTWNPLVGCTHHLRPILPSTQRGGMRER